MQSMVKSLLSNIEAIYNVVVSLALQIKILKNTELSTIISENAQIVVTCDSDWSSQDFVTTPIEFSSRNSTTANLSICHAIQTTTILSQVWTVLTKIHSMLCYGDVYSMTTDHGYY